MTAAPARKETTPSRDGASSAEQRGPDLQELIAAHGGYDQITASAWRAYDREQAEWRARAAVGDFHRPPYRYRGFK
jgi:hypothetical protein